MTHHDVLRCAQEHATRYLDSLSARPAGATLDAAELRRRLGGLLPKGPTHAVEVINDLVRDVLTAAPRIPDLAVIPHCGEPTVDTPVSSPVPG